MAYTSPRRYSLRKSALRSWARYSWGESRRVDAVDITEPSHAHCRRRSVRARWSTPQLLVGESAACLHRFLNERNKGLLGLGSDREGGLHVDPIGLEFESFQHLHQFFHQVHHGHRNELRRLL